MARFMISGLIDHYIFFGIVILKVTHFPENSN